MASSLRSDETFWLVGADRKVVFDLMNIQAMLHACSELGLAIVIGCW